jgi:TPR repeat protein
MQGIDYGRFIGSADVFGRGRASRLALFALGFAVISAGFSGPAPALDADQRPTTAAAPLSIFKDPRAPLHGASDAARSAGGSVEALRYSADSGESLAAWKLARMYADGDGVARDDRKAFDYFAKIVEHFSNDDPSPSERTMASNAFVALGAYLRDGVAGAQIAADPERAFDLFRYAATFFRNADAQYNVARMYLQGQGVKKDSRQGMAWLDLAARKGHPEAQALLGQMMFEGPAAQRPRGLMLLAMARASVGSRPSEQWIADLHEKALATASDADRAAAESLLSGQSKRKD